MSDKLEKFISDNREGFDIYETDPSVWDNVQIRKKESIFRIAFVNNTLVKIAAAMLLLVSLGWLFVKQNKNSINQSVETLLMPEVAKTEAFYEAQYQTKLNEVEKHLTTYPDLKYNLNTDLQQLDSLYADIKKDLKDGIANENIIEAMIQNYQMKIKILEDVLYFVQRQKNGTMPEFSETEENPTYEI